jgi:hypothetical protein
VCSSDLNFGAKDELKRGGQTGCYEAG